MNVIFILATAVTVSLDGLFVGVCVSQQRKDLALPVTVAAVTYAMCLAASILGQKLSTVFGGRYFGATILLFLGIFNLVKKDGAQRATNFLQNIALAVSVAMDGATAALSLAIQNEGDVLFTPLLFAATHFLTTFCGQTIGKHFDTEHGNVFSAVFLFVLAAMKFLGI